jgi:stage II sporulation protein D
LKSKILIFLFSLQLCTDVVAVIKPPTYSKNKVPKVRVRVGKSLKKVHVSGTDLFRKLHTINNSKSYAGRKRIKFNCDSIAKQKNSKPLLLASLESPTGLISLDKDKYRGLIHVVTSPSSKSCDVVNETNIENYISSLLSKEMNAVWPLEALKAQAIAARSYAIHKMETKQVSKILGHEAYYDLESSEKHQVGGTYFDSTYRTFQATMTTKGEVLVSQKGNMTPVFFHAKCGGRTLRPEQVWTNKVESYQGVKCPFCDNHGKKKWKGRVNLKRLYKFLKWAKSKNLIKTKTDFKKKKLLRIVPDKISRFNIRAYWGNESFMIAKSHFRRYFGRVIVPSNHFMLSMNRKGVNFNGKGLGHGVGMCQLGTLNLAKKGWSYKQILAHYFPSHSLKKLY